MSQTLTTSTAATLALALGAALTLAAAPAQAQNADQNMDKEKCFGVAMKGRTTAPPAPAPPARAPPRWITRATPGASCPGQLREDHVQDLADRPRPIANLQGKEGLKTRACRDGRPGRHRPQDEHALPLLEGAAAVDFLEIHAENYFVAGGPRLRRLERLRERLPLSLHGVGLSIGGEAPLDEAHLDALAALLQRFEPRWFSEHLAWSSHGGTWLNDLLPLPYDDATLQRVCEHIDRVQTRFRRRMLENPSSYVATSARPGTKALSSPKWCAAPAAACCSTSTTPT